MRSTSERRQTLLECLCERRHDKVERLAAEFGVSERTMRNDILILSCSYPVYTKQGNNGGVFVMEDFRLGERYLTARRAGLLLKLSAGLDGEEKEIMESIFERLLSPGDKGGYI